MDDLKSYVSISTLLSWLVLTPPYGYTGVALWWAFWVVVVYTGVGVASLLSAYFKSYQKKPSWDQYTANLVAKEATTATDLKLLIRYAKGNVLDIGCGNGITLSKIYRSSEIRYAFGIDPGLPGLIYAKQRFPEIEYIRGSACNLPFADNQFDLIYMIDVIEHLDEPRQAIKEVYRVCKIGSHIFIQTPNYPVKRIYDLWHFIRRSRATWRDDPTHVTRLNAWNVVKMVRDAGFCIEEVVARNVPFRIDKRITISTWNVRKSLLGKLLGQKVIVVASKKS